MERITLDVSTIAPDVRAQILKMGRLDWGQTGAKPDSEHLQELADTLKHTRRDHALDNGDRDFHGAYLAGTNVPLCHTGTSPNSPLNAKILVGLWNSVHDVLTTPGDAAAPADTETQPPIHAAIPDGEVDEIRKRHEIYSDDEIAASFFDPDGYKAHSDRATLLARLTALEAENKGLNGALEISADANAKLGLMVTALKAEVAEARAKAIEEYCDKICACIKKTSDRLELILAMDEVNNTYVRASQGESSGPR